MIKDLNCWKIYRIREKHFFVEIFFVEEFPDQGGIFFMKNFPNQAKIFFVENFHQFYTVENFHDQEKTH